MKCLNCGSEVNDGDKFCNSCGAVVGSPVAAAQYNDVSKKSSALFWVLFTLIILSAVFCFLPYLSVLGVKMNYVYFDSGFGEAEIKDGIFIVIFSALSMLFLLLKKRIPVLVFQVLSLAVFFFDYINDKDKIGYLMQYEVGFYLVLITLIASFVIALLRLILKKKFK